jgi:hypothetical protein
LADARLRQPHHNEQQVDENREKAAMKTILVVEDDPNQSLLYEQELEDEGFHVLRAANGREGLEMMHFACTPSSRIPLRPKTVVGRRTLPWFKDPNTIRRFVDVKPQVSVQNFS